MASPTIEIRNHDPTSTPSAAKVDMQVRAGRNPRFGCRPREAVLREARVVLDADFASGDDYRVVQFTPPQ